MGVLFSNSDLLKLKQVFSGDNQCLVLFRVAGSKVSQNITGCGVAEMKAMVLNEICNLQANRTPLKPTVLPDPVPQKKEILVKVSACGVCHTELDEIEGRTPPPQLPVVPGHQVVGTVARTGPNAHRFKAGERVGIAWIYSACGQCTHCEQGAENLCDGFRATGRDANGGYAQYMKVLQDFAYRIPDVFSDSQAAPLLCAGAIGFRSLMLTNILNGQNLGLTGFGHRPTLC